MKTTQKLSVSALMLALGMVLPFFIGQIAVIGNMLLPMHIPVFFADCFAVGNMADSLGLVYRYCVV